MIPSLYRTLFFPGILALSLTLCAGLVTQAKSAAKNHPKDWMTTHGQEFFSKKNECLACHGDQLDGGATGVACNMCHLSPKHPEGWGSQHGAPAMKDGLNQCFPCHGDKLDGGKTSVGCGTCHINPKHPDNWLGEHGSSFLTSKDQCQACHGRAAFGLSSKKSTSQCLSCHTGVLNAAEWQQESNSNTFDANLSSRFQIRTNSAGDREYETQNRVGFQIVEQNQDISFTSQFRFSQEWTSDEYLVDMYETGVQFNGLFNHHATLNLGRQSLISNIDYILMDGVALTVAPSRLFDISLYAGVPRYYDDDDFEGEIGLISGLGLILNQIAYTNARLDVLYQKENFTDNDLNDTDKIYISGSASKGLSIFRFYGLGEYDVTDTLPTTATVGAEVYPFVKKVGFLIEGNYFDESRNDDLETIFSILSADRLWQVKSGVFVNAVRHLSLSQNFSLQRFQVLSGQTEDGYNAETGLSYDFEKIRLNIDLGYYFIDNYGGTLHGVRAVLYEDWSQTVYSRVFADYVTYSKITNDNDVGLSLEGATGLNFNNGITLEALVEYNRNNAFTHDVRGGFMLSYFFTNRFADWKQRGKNP